MRGTRFAVAVSRVIVLIGSSAVLMTTPSEAVAKGDHFVIRASRTAEFNLKGSNGFSISVSASGSQVSLTTRKGGSSVSYFANGVISSKRIKARFGNLGSVSVRFQSTGPAHRKAAERGCKGEGGTLQPGKFIGTVEFEGEQGYTTAHASKVPGRVVVVPKQVCQGEAGEAGSPFRVIALTATSKSHGVVFFGLRATHGSSGFASFDATLFESQGRLGIIRSIEGNGEASAFTTSEAGGEITSAVITPPSPFTGSATYEKQKGQPATWTGTLAGTFLGRGEVSLVGPEFKAEVLP